MTIADTAARAFRGRAARAAGAVLLGAALTACLHTERASAPPGGGPANGASIAPSLSADGRFVAFRSDASNLVGDDTNGVTDLFVRDNATRQVERVSLAADDSELDLPVLAGSTGGDGRYAWFITEAAATPDDADALMDLFRRDLVTGTTVLATVPATGGADVAWPQAKWSPGGRYAAFTTGDDYYRRDLETGVTTRVLQGEELSGGSPMFVADTGRVAWLVGTGGAGTYVLFGNLDGSVRYHGPLQFGPMLHLASTFDMSPDGRWFAGSTNHTGAEIDTWVLDVETGDVRQVPGLAPGFAEVAVEFHPSISADGRFVAYSRGIIDRYGELGRDERVVVDLELGTLTVVERRPGESPAWQLSADGRWLAHSSLGDDADGNGLPDVYFTFAHEPRVVAVTGGDVGPGTSTLVVEVEEVVGEPSVAVAGGGVSVLDVRLVAPGVVEVDLSVSPGAAPGPRDLSVRNRGDWPGRALFGGWSTCRGCVTVAG